jgi:hypothetical protein
MRIGAKRVLLGLVSIAAALAITPANAAASVSVAPTGLGFGNVPVGGSASRQVTLTVNCSAPVLGTCPLWAADFYYVHPVATGDFHATTTCPNPLAPALNVLVDSCTVNVVFRPTAVGQRSGTLSTGTVDIVGLLPGPAVSLLGAGVAASGSPKPSAYGIEGTRAKKCRHKKRHRAAQVSKKKKCKKRKRHH